MVAKMEPHSGVETAAEKPQPKSNADTAPTPSVRAGDAGDVPINIKKEEPEDVKINLAAIQSDDIFNDVDGPEYVDLEYEGIAELNGVEHFVCENFKIRQIPQPVVIIRPLSSLYVGYFIPPIVFNVKQKTVKIGGRKTIDHKRVCVDGKQRLTSVQKFMNGHIGFYDGNRPSKKWYYCHPKVNGAETVSSHNILPSSVKTFFRSKSFCCYEYDELTAETEETMFQLVQRGIALTPAEKMRAMSTEWATFSKQYEEDYPMIVNLSKQNRASGFRLILTIFAMLQEVNASHRKRALAPTLQASPQALIHLLDDTSPITPLLKLRYKAIFDRFEVLIKLSSTRITTTRYKINTNSVFDPAPDFLRGDDVEHVRTFSPLELIATAILVSCQMDNRSDAALLEDVKGMRHYLRIKHKDLRVNSQCWTTVWEYITQLEKRNRAAASTSLETEGFNNGLANGNAIAGSASSAPPPSPSTKGSNSNGPESTSDRSYPKRFSKRLQQSDGAQETPKKRLK